MDVQALSGPQRAAVFLLSLDEAQAVEVLQQMSPREIQDLGESIRDLKISDAQVIEQVQQQFLTVSSDAGLIAGVRSAFMRVANQALGERANNLLAGIGGPAEAPLSALDGTDERALANLLRKEHPQTVALVLAHASAEVGAPALAQLDTDLQVDVVRRLAMMEPVSPEVVAEVGAVLGGQVASMGQSSTSQATVGGVKVAAEMVNRLPRTDESGLLSRLDEEEPELAEQIRQLKFTFDDLAGVDGRGIQALLREVDTDTLLLALKTATEEVKDKILSNVSTRAAEMLREDLESMGPTRLADVQGAQQQILRVARNLEEAGQIVLGGGSGEDALV